MPPVMKTFFLIFVSIVLSNISYSQDIWTKVFDNRAKTKVIDMDLMNDSVMIIANYNTISCRINQLLAYDINGNLNWINSSSYDSDGGYFEKVKVIGDFIYTAGFSSADDCISEHDPIIFSKLDKNGVRIFSAYNERGDYQLPYNSFPKSLDVIEGEYFLINIKTYYPTKNFIVLANESGDILWAKNYNFEIETVSFIDNNNILIHGDNSIKTANISGIVANTVDFTGNSLKVIVFNNSIYQLFSDRLVKYTSGLESAEVVLLADGLNFRSLNVFNNELWIMGYNENDEILLSKLEDNYATNYLTFENYLTDSDFLITDGRINIIGISQNGQIAICSYDIESESYEYEWGDIEIIDFDISELDMIYHGSNISGFSFKPVITIKNNGNKPISSASVFSKLVFGYNCISLFYYKKIEALGLLAGETKTLTLETLSEYIPPSANYELCIEVLAPNSELELNLSNNILCKFINVLMPIEEIEEDESATISVFPNPVSNYITINLKKDEFYKIKLYNLNGVCVFKTITNMESLEIDITSMKSGLYILSVTSYEEQLNFKIVKP